jgi:hypothetical protein
LSKLGIPGFKLAMYDCDGATSVDSNLSIETLGHGSRNPNYANRQGENYPAKQWAGN